MEIVLFVVSGVSMIYYAVLVIFTDATLFTQLYWPASSLVFVLIAVILHIDRRRKQEHKRCLSLELRTFICTSCGLYFVMIGIFSVLILFQAFSENSENIDYLIFIENGDVESSLTQEDYNSLNCTIEYMTKHENVSVVLAGCSRYRDLEVNEAELQDLMRNYLLQHGISKERIITEEISNNLRQNIIYSYSYILMDWYGRNADRDVEPTVGIVAEPTSIFRYQMILDNLNQNMEILSFQESILYWPARIVEETQLILEYHLINQFEW